MEKSLSRNLKILIWLQKMLYEYLSLSSSFQQSTPQELILTLHPFCYNLCSFQCLSPESECAALAMTSCLLESLGWDALSQDINRKLHPDVCFGSTTWRTRWNCSLQSADYLHQSSWHDSGFHLSVTNSLSWSFQQIWPPMKESCCSATRSIWFCQTAFWNDNICTLSKPSI